MITHYRSQFVCKVYSRVMRHFLGSITHVITTEPVAALTFDDGPHAEYTPHLLDILERHQAQATFFMLGQSAIQYPELLRRIAQAGHAIGNHSWDHASFPFITSRKRREQIRACARALAPYGQRLFRPPYGQQNLASRLDILWMRHKVILFNCEVGDWFNPNPHLMAEALVKKVIPGSIVCLHDAIRAHPELIPTLRHQPHTDREAMLIAVDMFLTRVDSRLRFITVPELLRCGDPQRQDWYRVTPLAQRSSAAPLPSS
jgi:peptidoglycan/xylan/chitin deacetylase (PgdA/CDA1 family)